MKKAFLCCLLGVEGRLGGMFGGGDESFASFNEQSAPPPPPPPLDGAPPPPLDDAAPPLDDASMLHKLHSEEDEQWQSIFAAFDTDHSGTVSAPELGAGAKSFGLAGGDAAVPPGGLHFPQFKKLMEESKAHDHRGGEGGEGGAALDGTPLMKDLVDTLDEAPTRSIDAASATVRDIGAGVIASAVEKVDQGQLADEAADASAIDADIGANPMLSPVQESEAAQAEGELRAESEPVETHKSVTNQVLFSMRKELVQDVDQDGDGLLSKAELTAQVKKAWSHVQRLRDAELRAKEKKGLTDFIHSLAGPAAASVTEQQLLGSFEEGSLPSGVPVSEKLSSDAERARSAFRFADADRDGRLTESELFTMFNPSLASESSAAERRRYLDFTGDEDFYGADGDGDGKVTLDEWHQFRLRDDPDFLLDDKTFMAMDWKNRRKEFRNADANGDGALSKRETEALAEAQDADKYAMPVALVMGMADDNHDGQLSLAELDKHTKQFDSTGSQDFFTIPSLIDSKIAAAKAKAQVSAHP
jgi:Ca2+-binding EF-hand superfamily protein